MSSVRSMEVPDQLRPFPAILDAIPILYEDEEDPEMGDNNAHSTADEILHIGLKSHLADQPELESYRNMNLYYLDEPVHPRTGSAPYVSPDNMVVRPFKPLGENVPSYKIGRDGPAPLAVAEVLSERTAQQRDLDEKLLIYAKLGICEYILIDGSGRYLPQRLLLKRLQPDRTWVDERDPDGGVTSQLGFRLIFEDDDMLRVINAETGYRYIRPLEAEEKVREAEAKAREAEALAKSTATAQRKAERERKKAEAARDTAVQNLEQAIARSEEEAAARRQIEQQLRALQAEIERLRQDSTSD